MVIIPISPVLLFLPMSNVTPSLMISGFRNMDFVSNSLEVKRSVMGLITILRFMSTWHHARDDVLYLRLKFDQRIDQPYVKAQSLKGVKYYFEMWVEGNGRNYELDSH